MKTTNTILKTVLMLITLGLGFNFQAIGYVKVGNNPATITASMNLEVEATNASKTVITKDLGKVGVNTTSLTTDLDVNGNARIGTVALKATSSKVLVTTAADGVVMMIGQAQQDLIY